MIEVVLSGENRIDDYGNYRFKDKSGKEHKIGTKREDFDELCKLIDDNPDRAVSLEYDEYKGRSYIVGVKLLEIETQDESRIPTPPAEATSGPAKPGQEFAPQEIGMWWKEIGENIRAGITKYDTPIGKAQIAAYSARMHLVLGIKKEE